MKIRLGFVSNSSSSSYVCDVTGEAFEVHDGCFRYAGLVRCVNGHIFKEEFLVQWEPEYPDRDTMWTKLDEVTDSKKECAEYRKMGLEKLRKVFTEKVLNYADDSYEVHQNQCPICTMAHVKDSDLIMVLLAKHGITRNQVIEEIRERFKTYEEFNCWIKKTEAFDEFVKRQSK